MFSYLKKYQITFEVIKNELDFMSAWKHDYVVNRTTLKCSESNL